jgi:16S rRNA (guanine527-N7)-methyltransferase
MTPDRIAELLEPFLGSEGHSRLKVQELLPRISMYVDILDRWNARVNLTAIRDPEEVVTRHFGESFFAARHLFPSAAPDKTDDSLVRVADLGSGAGFPGIPIKLWTPGIALTLIESNQKKATFLREVVRALTLTNVHIQNARGEALPPAGYDVVTLRAVERFSDALPVVGHLLAPSGRVALLISSAQEDAARSGLPGMIWEPPLPVPVSRSRVLLLGESEPN